RQYLGAFHASFKRIVKCSLLTEGESIKIFFSGLNAHTKLRIATRVRDTYWTDGGFEVEVEDVGWERLAAIVERESGNQETVERACPDQAQMSQVPIPRSAPIVSMIPQSAPSIPVVPMPAQLVVPPLAPVPAPVPTQTTAVAPQPATNPTSQNP